jgi:predicted enzyme related to lactoylglutathione lyase
MNITLVLDCNDPDRLAEFWSAALGYTNAGHADPYVALVAEGRPMILLQRVSEPKVGKNRMHLDLHPENVEPEVERLVTLGATRVSADVLSAHGHRWIVMADPEGNEFCVCDANC